MANTRKPSQVSSSSSSSLESVSTATSSAKSAYGNSSMMNHQSSEITMRASSHQITAANTPVPMGNPNIGLNIDDTACMPLPVLSDLEGINIATSIFTPNILNMQQQQAASSTTLNRHPAMTPTNNLNTDSVPMATSSMDFSNMDGISIHFPLTEGTSSTSNNSTILNTHTQFDGSMIPQVPVANPPATTATISDEAVAQIVSNTSVPEFLYQLTKMLTDDHRDIIEWSNSKIEVHNPHRLESEVLNKYFRHSKYASFQRQLNYFGFRKLAGKGKMAPCSYVNENATNDLRSLLRMKRKTSATTKGGDSSKSDNKGKKRSVSIGNGTLSNAVPINALSSGSHGGSITKGVKRSRSKKNNNSSAVKIAVGKGVRHQLNGYLRNNGATPTPILSGSGDCVDTNPSSLAKSVVGKGVAHHFTLQSGASTVSSESSASGAITTKSLDGFRDQGTGNKFTFLDPSQLGMGIDSVDNNLSELQNNYHSSLNASNDQRGGVQSNNALTPSGNPLKRESSLVALAMIPSLSSFEAVSMESVQSSINVQIDSNSHRDGTNTVSNEDKGDMMSFIDFP
jgi:hypothetical protein